MEKLLTTAEIATQYNVAQITVISWIRQGKLEAVRVGSNYRIDRAALERFVDASTTGGTPPAWKTDFSAYQADEQAAYEALSKDAAFIAKCQSFHPKLDIPLSLQRSHEEYWATEAAWEKKRAMLSRTINWRLSYQKNLDKSPVYKDTSSQSANRDWVYVPPAPGSLPSPPETGGAK